MCLNSRGSGRRLGKYVGIFTSSALLLSRSVGGERGGRLDGWCVSRAAEDGPRPQLRSSTLGGLILQSPMRLYDGRRCFPGDLCLTGHGPWADDFCRDVGSRIESRGTYVERTDELSALSSDFRQKFSEPEHRLCSLGIQANQL
jgi:hypothetical protein